MNDVDELVAWLRQQLDEDAEAWQMVASRDVVEMLRGRPPAPQMLADVARKRQIVDGCEEACRVAESDHAYGWQLQHRDTLLNVIHLLAQPYADRPGFRDEWRVQ